MSGKEAEKDQFDQPIEKRWVGVVRYRTHPSFVVRTHVDNFDQKDEGVLLVYPEYEGFPRIERLVPWHGIIDIVLREEETPILFGSKKRNAYFEPRNRDSREQGA